MSGTTFHATPVGEHEITITRSFDAPRAAVFDAHVDPAWIRRWMLGPEGNTMPVCEHDVRPGGTLRFVWRGPDGREIAMSGVYRDVVRPERIVHTELFEPDWTEGEALVTTTFDEAEGRTTLVQTMRYATRAVRDAVLATGMEHGVAASHARLDALLGEAC